MRRAIHWSAAVAFLISIFTSAQAQHTVQTIAGGGPNGLPAANSSMGSPSAIAQDGVGNLYIFDSDTQRVLKEDSQGNISVVAGSGVCGTFWSTNPFTEPFSCERTIDGTVAQFGDGGSALGAQFTAWTGMAVDGPGNIYIASGCVVRKVDTTSGLVNTIAGNGNCGYTGDQGPALNATLNCPYGLFVDGDGDLFIADQCNHVVRKMSSSTGTITTVAGNGTPGYSGDGGPATQAELFYVDGVFVDASKNLFITDSASCVIREVSASTGNISTIAGSNSLGCGDTGDGGPATSAQLVPYGIYLDAQGNIYVSDPPDSVVREISATTGDISTIAGSASLGAGYSGDGGSATNAQLHSPYGVTVDANGNVFIADWNNHVVREVSGGTISTAAGVFLLPMIPRDARQTSGAVSSMAVNDVIGYSGQGRLFSSQHLPSDMMINGHLLAPGSIQAIRDGASVRLQTFGLPYLGGEGSLASKAPLGYPYHMTFDAAGNLFIADKLGNDVREIAAATGILTTVAGNGVNGNSGDGSFATQAELSYPVGVAVDGLGNVYIADSENCAVREVTAATGKISTVAGTNHTCRFSGDGQAATAAQLGILGAIALDGSGNLFVADLNNSRIREVTVADETIHTVAGGGSTPGNGDGSLATSAVIGKPWGVTVDKAGNLYIGDTQNCVLWKVTAADGIIHLFAGTYGSCGYTGDGGPATSAEIMYVFGSAYLNSAGDLFFPDAANAVIRKVSAADGTISTVAGNGTPGFGGDGGDALSAEFYAPVSVLGDASGNLLVADGMRIRSISGLALAALPAASLSPGTLSFAPATLGTGSSSSQVTVTNTGTAALSISTVAVSGAQQADFKETNNCSGQSVAAGLSCTVNVSFTPSITGGEGASLTVTDNAGTQTVSLVGGGIDFSAAAAPGGSASATVNQGQTATYSLELDATGGAGTSRRRFPMTSQGSTSINVTLSCTGAPTGAVCTVPSQPVAITLGTPATLTVSVSTTASTTAALPASRGTSPPSRSLWMALEVTMLAFPLCFLPARRRRWALAMAPIALMLFVMSCSDYPSQSPTGGTPPGSYTLTLTAISGNDSHTMELTLNVTAQ